MHRSNGCSCGGGTRKYQPQLSGELHDEETSDYTSVSEPHSVFVWGLKKQPTRGGGEEADEGHAERDTTDFCIVPDWVMQQAHLIESWEGTDEDVAQTSSSRSACLNNIVFLWPKMSAEDGEGLGDGASERLDEGKANDCSEEIRRKCDARFKAFADV